MTLHAWAITSSLEILTTVVLLKISEFNLPAWKIQIRFSLDDIFMIQFFSLKLWEVLNMFTEASINLKLHYLTFLYIVFKVLFNCINEWFIFVDCWHQEPHFRPTFNDIIRSLEEVKLSSFMTTPQDSFHSLQEDWRLEIEEMFDELRLREKVGTCYQESS